MARIVLAGGGACGLLAAMLLADDGHELVVLERDDAEPPAPAEAWDTWERRGVNQFRLPHGLLPRFRQEAIVELPSVVERLTREGAYESNMLGPGGPPEYLGLTAKRPFVEACIAHEAAAMSAIDIRRGVSVAGLIVGASAMAGVPHVVGVRLESGEELLADLVIDAGGRRSALPRWLSEVGARPSIDEKEDSGFVYYGTHYQARDGVQRASGPVTRSFGSVAVLALAAELGTWGVGLITASGDKELRCLKDKERWLRVMRAMPESEHLLDGEPLHEIRVMGGIEDRYRRHVVDGVPVATGVVAIADAIAATNPSKGRGISMGLLHAISLRDTIRKVGLDDPPAFSLAFDEVTEATITPLYRSTLWDDRHRIREVDAARTGHTPASSDGQWQEWKAFFAVASKGGPLLPLLLDWVLMRRTPEDILGDPEVQAVLEAEAPPERHPAPGPSRAELLELVAG